jgi:PPM family protein phosphatase
LTRWRYAAATDTGLVRDLNEDAIFVNDSLAVVADGMGGHAAGEVASAMAVDLLVDEFLHRPTVEGLQRAIEAANDQIIADARETPEHFGMGTTVIAVGLTEDAHGVTSATLFNVGDSRAYQLRDGALRQLSEDHSVAEEWVRMGRLTPEEAAVHPRRHQLTRTLGVEETVEVDVMSVIASPGDRLLLCSDGLSNELSPEIIAQLASGPMPLEEAVGALIDAARSAGGRDNISAVLLEFDEVTNADPPIKRTVSTARPPAAPSTTTSARHARRTPRFTWRVVAAVTLILVVIGTAIYVVHWYAYSTYYLAEDTGVIAVYQGQPNGVLWFQPRKVTDTPYHVTQLRSLDQRALTATIAEPTLTSALHYAAYLHSAWQLSRPATPTPTTTTTTTTPRVVTTTTLKKAG